MNMAKRTGVKYLKDVTTFLTSGTLGYYLLLFLVKIISYMPFGLLYLLSDMLFPIFYFVIRYRRKIVRKNLTESFPNKDSDEISCIEKRFYHFLIDMAFESCKLASITPNEIKRRMKFINVEIANEMFSEGKSISILLGHYGNWEWTSSIALWLFEGAVIAQVYHKLHNEPMDRVMRMLRERMGHKCVDMYKTVRYMADAAGNEKPYMIGFLADQSPKRREAKYFIHFLNHEIPVLTGTEKATKHFGYNALFLSMKRVKRGYYECEISSLHDNPSSLPDFELTNLYFRRLEDEILQRPELYLWTHNRFKYAINFVGQQIW